MKTPASSTISGALPTTLEESNRLLLLQREEIAQLKLELANIKRMIFGQKRERFVAAAPAATEEQLTLELEQAGAKIPGFAETKERITYERRKPKGHGRKPIPDDLHREKHLLDVAEADKVCSCCGAAKKHIGDDITEELEYKPAVFFVNQYVRSKWVCPNCPGQGVKTAELPSRPIDKGIAGTGLLSYILVSKHVDHLPLYRLEQMFKRYDITISRSTMDGWVAKVCENLKPIYEQMHQHLIRDSFLVQGDETTIRVQDDSVIDKCDVGYLWPFVGDGKLAVFEFRDSRSRDGPSDFLKGFEERYLMSDGYAGYNQVITQNRLHHLMCWAHVRRKFFEAKELQPVFAERALGLIAELYAVEREAAQQNMPPPQRVDMRQTKSRAVLQKIECLLKDPGATILPKSKLGVAVAYTLNHWEQLNRFLEDGRLPIDNNLVENTIRPVALGRKNWLFAGSAEGAKRLAIVYSFAATCKLNNINLYEYFYHTLPIIASYPDKSIADLMPQNWKRPQNG